eukprot:m.225456 g.225456  ORF g.225456 m.225456 type:complete len:131 (-) comp33461_c0_seq4:352-744(-)
MVGGSLRSILHSDQVLSWERNQSIAIDIARGMAHLHKLQIIHRDLKSDNCLCDGSFNTKVADFGTSRILDAKEKSLTVVETHMGSPSKVSPASRLLLNHERDQVYQSDSEQSSLLAARNTDTKWMYTHIR